MAKYQQNLWLLYFLPVATVLLLAGCAVPIPTYSVSSANVAAVRELKKGIELQTFSGQQKSVSCRALQITPDSDRTFAQYIQGALNDEIVIAGTKKGLPSSQLALQVREVSLDCAIGTGSWSFDVEVGVQSHPPYNIKSTRVFNGSFDGLIVRERAIQALVPSVQQLIKDVMAHPTFKSEFGGS